MKELFIPTTILAIASYAIALLAGYILNKKSQQKFFKSKHFLVISVWFLLYFAFVLFDISNQLFQILVMLYIVYKIRQDVLDNITIKKWFESVTYGLAVLLGIVALWMLSTMTTSATLATIFGTLYASGFSYIAQKNLKKHNIKILKNFFSWEVLGARLIGSLIGAWLVSLFIANVDLWTGVLVFIGSTFGEWLNSLVKKQLEIKKWSESSFAVAGIIDNSCGIGFAALTVLLVQYF